MKGIFGFVKYPSTAGVIGTIWLGSAILMVADRGLPIFKIVVMNMAASFFIGYIGFRVEKR